MTGAPRFLWDPNAYVLGSSDPGGAFAPCGRRCVGAAFRSENTRFRFFVTRDLVFARASAEIREVSGDLRVARDMLFYRLHAQLA